MSIQRSGPVPEFCEYLIKKALLPHYSTAQINNILALGISDWLEIPRYQRGISWKISDVEEFLESNSKLLGNVILAQLNDSRTVCLNSSFDVYLVLVDGLQRFSIGTIILSILEELVFRSGSSYHAVAMSNFSSLFARVGSYSNVYIHNDLELRNHPRRAISLQYQSMREEVKDYIEKELINNAGVQLAQIINRTFLSRQIALDIYFNFNNPLEVMNTFIGINTGRVDLGPVDLLRANIVQKASLSGWSLNDINEIENNFTDVFTINEKPNSLLMPFVNVVLQQLSKNASRIFSSWSTGLTRSDVDIFLNFVEVFIDATSNNSYLREIKECGDVPIAIILSYYYSKMINDGYSKPTFLSNGSSENNELKSILIAIYRVVLDGTVSRTRKYAERILEGTLSGNLIDISNNISREFLNISINDQVEINWLNTSLNKCNKEKSKRVFNMMLLPTKTSISLLFNPLIFGRRAIDFHVDHLIPDALLRTGEEGQSLRNFAPCPQNLNSLAKATPCSSKLAHDGIYETYLNGNSHIHHPYCQWLVNKATLFNPDNLNNEVLLEMNQNPDIGSERIRTISMYLLARI